MIGWVVIADRISACEAPIITSQVTLVTEAGYPQVAIGRGAAGKHLRAGELLFSHGVYGLRPCRGVGCFVELGFPYRHAGMITVAPDQVFDFFVSIVLEDVGVVKILPATSWRFPPGYRTRRRHHKMPYCADNGIRGQNSIPPP